MSTKTRSTIKTSSSRTIPAQKTAPSLPKQRSTAPTRRQRQGRLSLAIVTLVAGGVGVAALWMGVGSEDAVEAPPLVPAEVQQNTDTSANAWERGMFQQGGQSSANAAEQGLAGGLTAQEWRSALDGLNRRAQAQAQSQAQGR